MHQLRRVLSAFLLVSLALAEVEGRRPGSFINSVTANAFPFTHRVLKARPAVHRDASESVSRGGAKGKLKNLQQRAVPAVLLLAGLYGIVRKYEERGLSALLLAISPGLYNEAVSVAEEAADNVDRYSNRWLWFTAYSLLITIPQFVTMNKATAQLISYLMILFGWVSWIITLNNLDASHSLLAWKEIAIYHVSVMLTLVPVGCWVAAIKAFGKEWPLYTALLVMLNDTSAYLVGVSMGKHPLLPTISPKKTWEGFVGAFILTSLLSKGLWNLLFQDEYNQSSLVMALFCSLIAPFGGFMASTIKRAFRKKDFSDLIVGHGGLIDRLDCQLVTAPFLYLYLKATSKH